ALRNNHYHQQFNNSHFHRSTFTTNQSQHTNQGGEEVDLGMFKKVVLHHHQVATSDFQQVLQDKKIRQKKNDQISPPKNEQD
ncbi:unnamed protein product, partial [Symbiodinium natans]